MALAQISSALGLAKGTAHGLLRTLHDVGFVDQDAVSGRYRVLLVDRRGAVAQRRGPGGAQRPERLDEPVGALGGRSCTTRHHGFGGRVRIEGVGLALDVTIEPVGSVDLNHPQALATQVPGQARTVGAGALHAHRHQMRPSVKNTNAA